MAEIIQYFLSLDLPEPVKIFLYVLGAVLLFVIGANFIASVLLTSKFELLFFSKSQLFLHKITKAVVYIFIFQISLIAYACILSLSFPVISELKIASLPFLIFIITLFGLITFMVFPNIKDTFQIILKKKDHRSNENKLPSKNRKIFYGIILSVNVLSGVLTYVLLFIDLFGKFGVALPVSNTELIVILSFFLLSPYGLMLFYHFSISQTIKKNINRLDKYTINILDISFMKNNNLVIYHSIEKEKFILVKSEDAQKTEELINHFFLYDLSNETIHEFIKLKILIAK